MIVGGVELNLNENGSVECDLIARGRVLPLNLARLVEHVRTHFTFVRADVHFKYSHPTVPRQLINNSEYNYDRIQPTLIEI
jgi:hypothetical protein